MSTDRKAIWVPMRMDAYLNIDGRQTVKTDPRSRAYLAPINTPDYNGLQSNDGLIQHDIFEHHRDAPYMGCADPERQLARRQGVCVEQPVSLLELSLTVIGIFIGRYHAFIAPASPLLARMTVLPLPHRRSSSAATLQLAKPSVGPIREHPFSDPFLNVGSSCAQYDHVRLVRSRAGS